jgi:cytochrome bd-type quinol oxidase subunit 2
MNRKFIISSLVMAFASLMVGFVIHGFFLQNDYARLPNLFRQEASAQNYFGYMLLAHLFIGIGLTWIYRQGHQAGKGVMVQGLRFGAAIAVVSTIPMYLIYFAVQPMPSDLVAQQIVFDSIGMLVMGLLVAWLNKSPG